MYKLIKLQCLAEKSNHALPTSKNGKPSYHPLASERFRMDAGMEEVRL